MLSWTSQSRSRRQWRQGWVNPLWLAEALAGGEEVAAGNLLVFRAGVDDPDVGPYKYANTELFNALTPSVRASFFLCLPNILTEAEWNKVASMVQRHRPSLTEAMA